MVAQRQHKVLGTCISERSNWKRRQTSLNPFCKTGVILRLFLLIFSSTYSIINWKAIFPPTVSVCSLGRSERVQPPLFSVWSRLQYRTTAACSYRLPQPPWEHSRSTGARDPRPPASSLLWIRSCCTGKTDTAAEKDSFSTSGSVPEQDRLSLWGQVQRLLIIRVSGRTNKWL